MVRYCILLHTILVSVDQASIPFKQCLPNTGTRQTTIHTHTNYARTQKKKKRKNSYEKEKKKKTNRTRLIWGTRDVDLKEKKTEQKRTDLNGWANEGAKLNWKRERITFVDVGVTVQMFINI